MLVRIKDIYRYMPHGYIHASGSRIAVHRYMHHSIGNIHLGYMHHIMDWIHASVIPASWNPGYKHHRFTHERCIIDVEEDKEVVNLVWVTSERREG